MFLNVLIFLKFSNVLNFGFLNFWKERLGVLAVITARYVGMYVDRGVCMHVGR